MDNLRRAFSTLLFLAGFSAARSQLPVVQSVLDAVNADTLMWHLDRLSGEVPVDIGAGPVTIASRHKFSPTNATAATWLQQRLSGYGWMPTVQSFSATGLNILATRAGSVHPGRKVILCAHYDAMPAPPAVAPAADDDGTGVVAVLEAARLLQGVQFENTLILALWDEEEQGKIGSIFYAGAAAANDDTLIAVVNMDAIGWDGNGDGLMRIHARATAGNSIAIKDTALLVNTTYGINQPIAVNTPGATYSDHASFWSEGYGAVLMIEDFDNDGNIHYHTQTDRVQYIDVPYFDALTRLSIGTALHFARPIDPGSGLSATAPSRPALHIYPDPTRGPLVVTSPEQELELLTVYDLSGRECLRVADGLKGRRMQVLETASLIPGTYVLRAVLRDGRAVAARFIRVN